MLSIDRKKSTGSSEARELKHLHKIYVIRSSRYALGTRYVILLLNIGEVSFTLTLVMSDTIRISQE